MKKKTGMKPFKSSAQMVNKPSAPKTSRFNIRYSQDQINLQDLSRQSKIRLFWIQQLQQSMST